MQLPMPSVAHFTIEHIYFYRARTRHQLYKPKWGWLSLLPQNITKTTIEYFYFHLDKHQTKRTKSHKRNAFLFKNTANGAAKARKMSPKYKSLNFGWLTDKVPEFNKIAEYGVVSCLLKVIKRAELVNVQVNVSDES